MYLCMYIQSDIENCEGWLSPSSLSSGGGALTAEVRGPRFNPGWLPVFHSSLKYSQAFPHAHAMESDVPHLVREEEMSNCRKRACTQGAIVVYTTMYQGVA